LGHIENYPYSCVLTVTSQVETVSNHITRLSTYFKNPVISLVSVSSCDVTAEKFIKNI
jgi:hypothetical protein